MCHRFWPKQSRLRSAVHQLVRVALGLSTAGGCFAYRYEQAWAQTANVEVTPPTVLTHVDAEYPPSALATREHADVVVAVTVDLDGHVSKTDILQSGGVDLDESAVIAVRQWTFVPAKRRGVAIASRIRVPFHFAPPSPPPEMIVAAVGCRDHAVPDNGRAAVACGIPSVHGGGDTGEGRARSGSDGDRTSRYAVPRRVGL